MLAIRVGGVASAFYCMPVGLQGPDRARGGRLGVTSGRA